MQVSKFKHRQQNFINLRVTAAEVEAIATALDFANRMYKENINSHWPRAYVLISRLSNQIKKDVKAINNGDNTTI